MSDLVMIWKVLEELSMSGHRIIRFDIQSTSKVDGIIRTGTPAQDT